MADFVGGIILFLNYYVKLPNNCQAKSGPIFYQINAGDFKSEIPEVELYDSVNRPSQADRQVGISC